MERIRVYIANLGKYNGGELVGAWFTPPIDSDEVKGRIGSNDEYEEYVTHDCELPFEINKYTPIEEINRLRGLAEELRGTPTGEVASEIQHASFDSFEKMVEHVDDTIYYPDYNGMSDVAYYLIAEAGDLDEIPGHLKTYIDFDAYGQDLEIGGNYLVTSRGVFELM